MFGRLAAPARAGKLAGGSCRVLGFGYVRRVTIVSKTGKNYSYPSLAMFGFGHS